MKTKDNLAITFQMTSEGIMTTMRNVCTMLVIVGLLMMGFVSLSQAALLTKDDYKLYGYVDVSYTHNFNNPSSQFNNGRIFDVDANSFRPHLAQMVFENEAKSDGGNSDRIGFRIKLNFGEDAQLTGGSILGDTPSPGAGGTAQSGTSNEHRDFDSGDDFDFQEAYAQYIAPIGNGLDLRIGRMNTLIGYEVIESPLNPNFSRSFLFGLGEPFTTTGLRASYEFTEQVNFSIGVINAWDGSTSDANRSKSVEALLGLTPLDWLSVSLFGFWGPEGAVGTKNRDLVQAGGIITAQILKQTSLVLEGYYAEQEDGVVVGGSRKDAQWHGIAGYVIHDFDKQWGVRLRGEWFKDADGFLTGTDQTLREGTVTLQYKPVPSLITRLEFRYDKASKNTFQFGSRAANHQETLATEVILLF